MIAVKNQHDFKNCSNLPAITSSVLPEGFEVFRRAHYTQVTAKKRLPFD